VLLIPLFSTWTMAQTGELSPEELDAAFTAADAAREAAGWSDKIIERRAVDPLATMSASADLVIRGTVTAQEVAYDANDVPFTHTTLGVSEVLEGSYADSQITIVQEGGPLKHKPENVLMLSHTHYFTPGQEELLFLELNPDSPYPYSQVVIKHRFGVVNGKVFNENGKGMIYTETEEAPGYKLSWSRDRNPDPRFTEFKIGSHEFSKQFRERDQEGDSPEQPVSRQRVEVRPGYESGVDVSTFKNALTRQGG
jgi:hypothetical protein